MATTRRKKSEGPAKLLSTTKVIRLLTEMKVDTEKFLHMYQEDTSRGIRTGFTDEEKKAFDAFLKAGHNPKAIRTLMEALDTTNIGTAMGKILRYQEAQEQGLI